MPDPPVYFKSAEQSARFFPKRNSSFIKHWLLIRPTSFDFQLVLSTNATTFHFLQRIVSSRQKVVTSCTRLETSKNSFLRPTENSCGELLVLESVFRTWHTILLALVLRGSRWIKTRDNCYGTIQKRVTYIYSCCRYILTWKHGYIRGNSGEFGLVRFVQSLETDEHNFPFDVKPLLRVSTQFLRLFMLEQNIDEQSIRS